ncbi:MAG: serine/threonine-protein phosphatase [Flavisolibacter sp.]|jgi:serine/threonine protein phosphatase PrpC|nr:serine/threonine-protein phosphatase [Flavisolibacter sp.]
MADNYFGITDTGKQRDNNEDSFIAQLVTGSRLLIACVIDGVGGYEGGEVAAEIAKQTIIDLVGKVKSPDVEMLRQALINANGNIFETKRARGSNPDMACVVTLALVDEKENKFYYAHVGDTRLYLFRDQSLVKVTRDQSFVGFLEDSGRLTEEEAMNHPKRNEINKALGFDQTVGTQKDYIDTGESPFLPGDLLLLCSDGLSDMVTSSNMISILNHQNDLQTKAKNLVEAANIGGGKDNITVVLVKNEKEPAKQKATRPLLIKKNDVQSPVASGPVEKEPAIREKPLKTNRSPIALILILSILCLLSIATSVWLFREHFIKKEQAVLPVHALNANEISLQDSVSSTTSNLLFLHHSVFGDTIRISQVIRINRDSLRIKGPVVIICDSSFVSGGPAFNLGPLCKNIVLDSIRFVGFELAILTREQSVLKMNQVTFDDTRISVAYALKDSSGILPIIPTNNNDSLNRSN